MICKTHNLLQLFNLFDEYDQDTLREYYVDFRATIGGHIATFPFKRLDDFLENLEGDRVGTTHVGSFDWRYFLIEENRSREMPLVSVDYLHEIVYGSTRIVERAVFGHSEPLQFTLSWRMVRERWRKYLDWSMVRMNSEGWDDLGDRVEVLWWPDYRDRYDVYVFRDKGIEQRFAELPGDLGLRLDDKLKEIEAFVPEEGLRSIGMSRTPSSSS